MSSVVGGDSANGWWTDAHQVESEWGRRWILAFSRRPSSSPKLRPAGELGGPGNRLQGPPQGHPLARPRPWGGSDPLHHPRLWLKSMRRRLQDLAPANWAAWGMAGCWEPGAFRDGGWAGSEALVLSGPPAELCLLLSGDRDLGGRAWCLVTWPFLLRTESNIRLVETYRNTITWPQEQRMWCREVCIRQPGSSLTFPRKGLCWELLRSLGFLRHKPPISSHGSGIKLPLFQTLDILGLFASLCVEGMDLCFGNSRRC